MQQYSELQRPDNTQFYDKIVTTWPRGPFVQLQIGDYPEILRIPQAFLEGCEGNHTLRFVEELAQLCVQEPGHLSNLEQLDLQIDQVPPTDHVLTFTADAPATVLTWSAGPDGRYRSRAPAPDEAFDDTASLRPSEVSNMQATLRWRIVARDGACVVSGTGFEDSQAAHLAPKHREDIYAAVVGADFVPPAYRTAYAVLLETSLHRRYDRFQWSFRPHGNDLIVYVFDGHPQLRPFHGHIIPADRFRLWPRDNLEAPDRRLMSWHYKQCVLKYLRGFWAP